MTTVKIDLPFADVGTKTPIDDTRTDGVVSLSQGYTDDYARELGVDPAAKPVERDKLNWLMNVITTNIIDWQLYAFPQYDATNSYTQGACVRYSPTPNTVPEATYRALKTTSALPSVVTDWEPVYTNAQINALIPMVERNAPTAAFDFNAAPYGTSSGVWEVTTDAIATASQHSPSQLAGMLETKLIVAGTLIQRYTDRGGFVFFRGQAAGTWTAWQSITGYSYTPADAARKINTPVGGGLQGGGDLTADRNLSLAPIAAYAFLCNPTGAAAVPIASTFNNNFSFNGSVVGLGDITPTSVVSAGRITTSNGQFVGTAAGTILAVATGGSVYLRGNGPTSTTNQGEFDINGAFSSQALFSVKGLDLGRNITQGSQILWNVIQNGLGITENINNFGAGSGGHAWYCRSSPATGSPTQIMFLNPAGNLSIAANYTGTNYTATAGNFVSSTTDVVLGPTGNGTIHLRSGGYNTLTNEVLVQGGMVIAAQGAYNPQSNTASAAFRTSGNWGGGISFTDMTGSGVIYFGGGAMNFRGGPGGGGATTSAGFSLDLSGNLIATGIIRPGSDARVKANPLKIENALSFVRRFLVGKTYNRTDDNGRLEAGYLAQELLGEESGHLVSVETLHEDQPAHIALDGSEFRDFHHVGYDNAVPYVGNAVTELHDIVLDQAETIRKLTARLEAVEAR